MFQVMGHNNTIRNPADKETKFKMTAHNFVLGDNNLIQGGFPNKTENRTG